MIQKVTIPKWQKGHFKKMSIQKYTVCTSLYTLQCVLHYTTACSFSIARSLLFPFDSPNFNIWHDIQARITTLKYLSKVAGSVPYRTRSRKILVSSLVMLTCPCVSFPYIICYSSIILFVLCFQSPHSCGSSSPLCFPILLRLNPLLHFSKRPSAPSYLHTSSGQPVFNAFFPHSQPLIDLPKATTASHHFPFPLLLRLFCWSIQVGEEEWEMKVGDSLSPCQVAVQRHRIVQCSWWGLKICWTHEKLATLEEGANPEGSPNVDVISAQHLANAVYGKNWKARGESTSLSSC